MQIGRNCQPKFPEDFCNRINKRSLKISALLEEAQGLEWNQRLRKEHFESLQTEGSTIWATVYLSIKQDTILVFSLEELDETKGKKLHATELRDVYCTVYTRLLIVLELYAVIMIDYIRRSLGEYCYSRSSSRATYDVISTSTLSHNRIIKCELDNEPIYIYTATTLGKLWSNSSKYISTKMISRHNVVSLLFVCFEKDTYIRRVVFSVFIFYLYNPNKYTRSAINARIKCFVIRQKREVSFGRFWRWPMQQKPYSTQRFAVWGN